jgi:hypothetical protein
MTAAAGTPARSNKGSNGSLTALLAIAALLLLAGAAVLYTLQSHAAAAAAAAPVDALYGIAIDAEGAVSGDDTALTNFQKQLQQLKDAALRTPAAPFAKDARFARLLNNAAAVVQARGALTDAGNAARETRDLVPRLVSEMGTLASGLSGASLDNANRALERFEVRAQRLQLDVTALSAGAANPSQAAQRLAESADYLGQVIQGLAGANTGLGLPKMTGADAEKRLKTLDSLYGNLNAAVRRAVAAAPTLPDAQAAARAVTSDARVLAGASATPDAKSTASSLPPWAPLALVVAALALVVFALIVASRLRKTVEQQRLVVDTQRK